MLDLFARPESLGFLPALMAVAAWAAWGSRLRLRRWRELGQSGRPPGTRAGWRLVAAVLVVLALAQPRWGRFVPPWVVRGRDVVVAVDVSRSMAAEDAVPDRLGVAVAAASSLVDSTRSEAGDRVAVVAFAGRGVVRCPLTFQRQAALDALAALRVGSVEPGGTDLGGAVDAALAAFDGEDHDGGRAIVLFSDGEDLAGPVAAATARAREAGVVVHAVAVGDPDRGHPIPTGPGRPPLAYQGRPVATRRSDALLDTLSQATGGALVKLGVVPADLGPTFRDRLATLATRARQVRRPAPRVERAPLFALAALVAVLLGSRPGLARRYGPFRPLGLVVLLGAFAAGADNPAADRPGTRIERGRARFRAGEFAAALAEFERAGALAPGAAVPAYDAAATLFQLGRFPEAIAAYERARERGGPTLGAKADFGLGNARLALGDLDSAVAAYDRCIDAAGAGPEAARVADDARINREFALALRRAEQAPERGDDSAPDSKSADPKPRPGEPEPRQPGGDPGSARPDAGRPDGDAAPGSSGSRGAGGQGGSGAAPPDLGSPGARLDAALKSIREGRETRPGDAPQAAGSTNLRDW